MGDIVKCGYIKRHSKSFLSGGWNNSFLQLQRDSRLSVFKKQGDSTVQGSIFMRDVCKYFAYGEYTNGMPDRPDLPAGARLECVMAIPQKPNSKAKIHWFLFRDPTELNDWMTAICSVLPPPSAKNPSGHQSAPHASAPHPGPPQPGPPHPGPPPPSGAPPALGFENLSLGGAPPPAHYQPPPPGYPAGPAPAYPQQQYQQPPHYPAAPPPGAYPQQQYYPQAPAPAAYPQQAYHYQHPPAPGGYYQQQPPVQYVQGHPQQAYGYQQPRVVYQTQPVTVIHKKSKGGNMGKVAAGVAGGALLGYGAASMMGGGWGHGRWGSWSSLSSFGSFGSCGSFGSFGSFD